MAIYTSTQLVSASNATYTTNGVGNITGATVRSLNLDWISSSVLINQNNAITGSQTISGSLAVNTGQGTEFRVTSTGVNIGNVTTDVHSIVGVSSVSGSLTITGSAYGNIVAVTVASNTASIDLAAGNFFTATLGSNATTFFNVINSRPGLTGNLVLTTGTNSTASFSSNVKQPSGSAYLPTSGSGQVDVLSLLATDSSNVYLVASKRFI